MAAAVPLDKQQENQAAPLSKASADAIATRRHYGDRQRESDREPAGHGQDKKKYVAADSGTELQRSRHRGGDPARLRSCAESLSKQRSSGILIFRIWRRTWDRLRTGQGTIRRRFAGSPGGQAESELDAAARNAGHGLFRDEEVWRCRDRVLSARRSGNARSDGRICLGGIAGQNRRPQGCFAGSHCFIKAAPLSNEGLLLVGQLWTEIGDYDRAVATLRQALASDPSFPKPTTTSLWPIFTPGSGAMPAPS